MERASAGMYVIVPELLAAVSCSTRFSNGMFERYTDQARTCIFHARHAAALSGSSFIETEHLLLGVLQADQRSASQLLGSDDVVNAIREQLGAPELSASETGPNRDLPLSHECKRALAYSAEESERMGVRHIGTDHLLLGLLREHECRAAQILRERGLEVSAVREKVAQAAGVMSAHVSRDDLHRIVDELPANHWDAALRALRGLLRQRNRAPALEHSLERFDDKARRTLFFARYQASQFGCMSIETEHLLLGLLREDKHLALRLLGGFTAIEELRKEITRLKPPRAKVSTSVDLPLGEASKRALAFAVEEADGLKHEQVGTEHLLIGLLREENCLASELLRTRGINVDMARKDLLGE